MEHLTAHAACYTQHAALAVHIILRGWSQISGRLAAATESRMQCGNLEQLAKGC